MGKKNDPKIWVVLPATLTIVLMGKFCPVFKVVICSYYRCGNFCYGTKDQINKETI